MCGHLNPSVETRDLFGNRRRPADVVLNNFGDAGLCIDVTVVNGFMHAQGNRTFALTEALNMADNRKRDTLEGVCADSGYQFSPFSMTTLGGFSVGVISGGSLTTAAECSWRFQVRVQRLD